MRIAVFCGSKHGVDPIFSQQTQCLAQALAIHKMSLVYGGGNVGLMGDLADAALAAGVDVLGVIPESLAKHELAHPRLNQLVVVKDMHERKAMMAQHADAFIALPGGVGTLEEIFEAWTWAQLGFHHKPCAFLNVNGYYDELKSFFATMAAKGFVSQAHIDMVLVEENIDVLLEKIKCYTAPTPKWHRS